MFKLLVCMLLDNQLAKHFMGITSLAGLAVEFQKFKANRPADFIAGGGLQCAFQKLDRFFRAADVIINTHNRSNGACGGIIHDGSVLVNQIKDGLEHSQLITGDFLPIAHSLEQSVLW